MKIKLLLLLLLGWAGVVYGQDNILSHEIEINPFGKNTYSFRYKKGSLVKFKILNVNTFIVKDSKAESKVENYSFDIPKIFQDIAKGTLANDVSKLEKMVIQEISSDTVLVNNIFIEKYSNFLKDLTFIEQSVDFENELNKLIGDDVFIKDTAALRFQASTLYNNIYCNDINVINKITALRENYTEMNAIYNEVNKTPEKQTFTVSGELKNNSGFTLKIKNAEINQISKNKFEEAMEYAKKTMLVFDDEKKKNEIIAKASAGKLLYQKIQIENFIYFSDAVQLNDDVVTLDYSLKSSDDKVLHKFNSIKIKTYGGVKVNFSTGYMLSLIGNDDYAIRYKGDGNSAGVSKLDKSDITHALGGLAHVFWDCGKNAQFGLSSGVSINTDAKLNFYGGVSVAFTEKNRLVFSTGLSFVNLNRLNRNNLDQDNNFVNLNNKEITYSQIYKPALFFGVTYNLFDTEK